MTLPVESMGAAGLKAGDEVMIGAEGLVVIAAGRVRKTPPR